MRDSLRRLVGVVVLGVVFVALMVHYSAAAPEHERIQQSLAKLDAATEHAGESVYVWARVEEVGESFVVRAGGNHLPVVGVDASVQPGDSIQIDGTIQPDGAVAAERVVVSEQTALWRLYAISAAALALAAVVFFRSWTVDLERVAIVPREERDA